MKKILGLVILAILFVGCGAEEKKEISPAKKIEQTEDRAKAMEAINKLMKAGEKGDITDRLEKIPKAY